MNINLNRASNARYEAPSKHRPHTKPKRKRLSNRERNRRAKQSREMKRKRSKR